MAGTQQGARVSVTVGGVSYGVWDSKTGGVKAAEPTKRRSGGSRKEKLYKTQPSYTDVTVVKVYDNPDHASVQALRGLVGMPGSVTEQQLDADDNNFGNPVTYTGIFYSLDDGESDITSTDNRMVTAIFAITDVA